LFRFDTSDTIRKPCPSGKPEAAGPIPCSAVTPGGATSPKGGGEVTVRPYELVVVLNPNLEEEPLEALITKLQEIITSRGGELVKTDKWGKRKLAYEIDGLTEGFYVVIDFQGEVAAAAELERVIKITDAVLRHLLTRTDE
jgi:small subunit ribosomal protein S6